LRVLVSTPPARFFNARDDMSTGKCCRNTSCWPLKSGRAVTFGAMRPPSYDGHPGVSVVCRTPAFALKREPG
jgi:hypothetical protein